MDLEKVQLLLAAREGQVGVLESRMASEGQRIRRLLPPGARHRRAVRLADDPTKEIAHGGVGQEGPGFETMFEVSAGPGASSDLVAALDGVVARLDEWVTPEHSAVVAGTERTVVAGTHPLVLLYPLRRLPRLGLADFQEYWRTTHAQVAQAVPGGQGYRQFHTDEEATKRAGSALGVGITDFDGIAEAYHSDLAAFRRIMSRPEVAQAALGDEKNFIDHRRSVMMGLCRLVWDAPA